MTGGLGLPKALCVHKSTVIVRVGSGRPLSSAVGAPTAQDDRRQRETTAVTKRSFRSGRFGLSLEAGLQLTLGLKPDPRSPPPLIPDPLAPETHHVLPDVPVADADRGRRAAGCLAGTGR